MNDMPKSVSDLFAKSQAEGFVLKIWLPEKKNLVVSVIAFDSNSITVEPYSLYGVSISPAQISLSEIKRVTLFKIKYNDPVYMQIREARIIADKLRAQRQALMHIQNNFTNTYDAILARPDKP